MDKISNAQEAFNYCQGAGATMDGLKRLKISENFTWGEVFTNRTILQAKQAGLQIFRNAEIQAEKLEKIREYLKNKLGPGVVMIVTSWYRPPAANAKAGGARGSMHLQALATDFIVPGFGDVAGNRRVQAILIPVKDQIGFCLEITNGKWTHVDNRQSHIVFENKGNGQYPVRGLEWMKSFVRANGG